MSMVAKVEFGEAVVRVVFAIANSLSSISRRDEKRNSSFAPEIYKSGRIWVRYSVMHLAKHLGRKEI